jgi:glycosyltransferase involved in cell wall biosynthesis
MKKILQICAIDLSVDALLKPMIQASMEHGYEVHSACADEGRFENLRGQGLTLHHVPVARKISPLENLKTVWHMYKLMRREKYDIVHVHTPVAALLGRVAAKLARVPHVLYTAHGFYFHDEMKPRTYNFFYKLEKYFCRFATDWLLLQSREDYELCVRDGFRPADRIIHLSNGVDIHTKFHPSLVSEDKRAQLREEFGLRPNEIVFTYLGRFTRHKGIFELLEAYRLLRQERDDVRLLMVGDIFASERDDEASYEQMKELLKMEGIVTPGFRKDTPDILAASDCYVLPSYREGLPRSIIEAMAMARPVVASNIRGSREEVFHGENGYLVEVQNAEDLYTYMKRIAESPEDREQFGKRGREIVEDLFDEQKVLDIQMKLFDQLTGSKRS